MTARALLDRIETLSPADRRREIALRARQAAPAEIEALTAELVADSLWGAEIAAALAREARAVTPLLALLGYPHARVRELAIAALPRCTEATPETVLAAYAGASARERARLIRSVRATRRSELADALLGAALHACRISEARLVLPAVSPDLAAEHLGTLIPGAEHPEHIVRAHPGPSIPVLLASVRVSAPAERAAVWTRIQPALGLAIAATGEDEAVRISARECPPAEGWEYDHGPLWDALVRANPEAATRELISTRLNLRQDLFLSRGTARFLAAQAPAALLDLLSAHLQDDYPSLLATRILTSAAPADARLLLATLIDRGVRVHTGRWDGDDLLPEIARNTAALLSPGEESAGWLPLSEAEPFLAPLLTDADPLRRARGYQTLITAAGLDSQAGLPALLTRHTALLGERGSVRGAALTTLADLPSRALSTLTADAFLPLLRAALSAPDRDLGTLYALSRIALRLLTASRGDDPLGWRILDAVAPITTIVWNLRVIPDELRALVIDRLLPHAHTTEALAQLSWMDPKHPGVTNELERRIAQLGPDDDAAAEALLTAWLRDRDTRTARVRALLSAASPLPAALASPAVRATLAHAASDLIAQALATAGLSDAGLLPETARSASWGAGTRALVAAAYGELLRASTDDEYAAREALGALARIPGYGLDVLRDLALAPDEAAADSPDADPSAARLRARATALLGARPEDAAADTDLCTILTSAADPAIGPLRRVAGAALVRRAGTLAAADSAALLDRIAAATNTVSARRLALAAVDRAAPIDHAARRLLILGADPHPDVVWTAIGLALGRAEAATERAFIRAEFAAGLTEEDALRAGSLLARIHPGSLSPAARSDATRAITAVVSAAGALSDAAVPLVHGWVSGAPELAAEVWHALAAAPEHCSPGTGRLVAAILAEGHVLGAREAIHALSLAPLARHTLGTILDAEHLLAGRRLPPESAEALRFVAEDLATTGEHARISARLAYSLFSVSDVPPAQLVPVLRAALAGRGSVAAETTTGFTAQHLAETPSRVWELVDALVTASADAAELIVAVDTLGRLSTASAPAADAAQEKLRALLPQLPPEPRERALDALARVAQPGVLPVRTRTV
ncbi:hypothetical protein D9V32_10405 [Mycetocola tolaasinivorans]|uniref:Uncharacterized protein n=1 Tax=Mycetocola tolaasinivorans TaxID=76635 RepID=A0A3L7A7G4_9MICO|nr:hypothetical protein [Mycetocola tolaasinivorans]RLP75292.1 hypothetical protein D9V32_10405 [Mycetocola tolaasinivorans]